MCELWFPFWHCFIWSCYGIETVEESSSSRSKFESEVKQLRKAYERLESENHELRSLLQQQQQQQGTADKGEKETPILAPGIMLSAVTKTLARKVVSQLGADASSPSQDSLEDSMRKVNKYVRNSSTCFSYYSHALIRKVIWINCWYVVNCSLLHTIFDQIICSVVIKYSVIKT